MTFAAVMLVILSVLCYTVQIFFSKMYSISYEGPEAAVTPVFATLFGLVTGVATLVYNGFRFQPGATTLILGLANGVVLFLFNLSSVNAARTGPYAFQSIMTLFGNTLMPILFVTVWWGDRLTLLQMAGIFAMLVSFVLFNLKGLKFEGLKKGYFLWVVLLFITNGLYGILIDAQQRVAMQTQRNEMIIATFTTSAVISLVYLAAVQGKHSLRAFRMGRKAWIYAGGSSAAAALAINLLMVTLRLIPAWILYTIINGSILILSAFLGMAVLHEKLTKHMLAGIAVGVVSLVLLSI